MNEVEILIVEDSQEDAELMLRALRKRNLANQVLVLDDGQDALDYLSGEGNYAGGKCPEIPRVVFLDLNLPRVNGIEVLRAIKSSERTKYVPVVIVTSSQEEPDLTKCYELGANSYVVKPVNFDAFTKVVSDLGFYWMAVNKNAAAGGKSV